MNAESHTELHEECGIVAVYQLNQGNALPVNVSQYIPGMLLDLQHRGQLSAGFSSYNNKRPRLLQTHKDLGNVESVFRMYRTRKARQLLERFGGTAAIGHVRYATSGKENKNFAQPFERVHGKKSKWFSIAFNGNLANFELLKKGLIEEGYHITYNADTEVIMHYLNRELATTEGHDFKEIFSSLARIFDGSFNIAFLDAAGNLVMVRDPKGIKPLCYGVKDNLLFVSSESVALTRLGILNYRDVEPGQMLIAGKQGYSVERYFPKQEREARCQFEWVYFANLASTLDQRSVYKVRRSLGKMLAEMEDLPLDDDVVVVPVPETSKIAADAFSFHLGVPVTEGLVRNRYVGRSFIEGQSRDEIVLRKFTPIREVLENKRVLLVDDSIVRGTTLKLIIRDLYKRGKVSEVHVRIAAPPIIAPCFYGIDMPTLQELFARKFLRNQENPTHFSKKALDAMAKDIGAHTLRYLSVKNLTDAIQMDTSQLCLACVNADYPTPWGCHHYKNQF